MTSSFCVKRCQKIGNQLYMISKAGNLMYEIARKLAQTKRDYVCNVQSMNLNQRIRESLKS